MGVVRTKQPKFPARLSRRSTLLDASVSDAVGIPQFGIGKGVLTLVMYIWNVSQNEGFNMVQQRFCEGFRGFLQVFVQAPKRKLFLFGKLTCEEPERLKG